VSERRADRAGLAAFLRARRGALQPEDVGMPRGRRRRATGLRREEVAVLCHLSTDYYTRIEQERGPHPSATMIASIAQGLHLSLDERDHLFRLAGHPPPPRGTDSEHVGPGMLRILDGLVGTAAEVTTELGETLRQTPLAAALTGDASQRTGMARSLAYRWFTDPDARRLHHPDDHAFLSRLFASGLREVVARRGPGSRADRVAEAVLARSGELRALWAAHEVGVRPRETKRFVHPEVGVLELHCQTLLDPDQAHHLLVYTAVPGSESHERLRLLSVIGPRTVS
jgi:hypothetical protein